MLGATRRPSCVLGRRHDRQRVRAHRQAPAHSAREAAATIWIIAVRWAPIARVEKGRRKLTVAQKGTISHAVRQRVSTRAPPSRCLGHTSSLPGRRRPWDRALGGELSPFLPERKGKARSRGAWLVWRERSDVSSDGSEATQLSRRAGDVTSVQVRFSPRAGWAPGVRVWSSGQFRAKPRSGGPGGGRRMRLLHSASARLRREGAGPAACESS